ncbi:MAG: tetratricopeptide repeat protein [Gammaproteobacteria bacterium]|nr:tetratricopeptide repeat protein [Gammaproteobacteria bacterium]
MLNLANTYLTAGKPEQAEALYRQILSENPEHAYALYGLGVIASERRELEIAEKHIRKAIQLHSEDASFHISLGIVLKSQNRLDEAVRCYETARKLNPDDLTAYYYLADTSQRQGKPYAAIEYYRQILRIRPNYAEAYCGMGKILSYQPGKLKLALKHYQQALQIKPDYAAAHAGLGHVAWKQDDFSKAKQHCRQAVRIDPDDPGINFQYSLLLLQEGDFAEGWQRYAYRLQLKDSVLRELKKPRWDGTPLNGRRLVVSWEQGLGDVMQFIRYLPMITGGTVIFECPQELIALVESFAGVDILLTTPMHNPREPEAGYDVHIPLLSLPYIFNTALHSIPAQIPYLYADANKIAAWRPRFDNATFNIGIVWSGNPAFADNRNRSCVLKDFLPLTGLSGAALFSLQKGNTVKAKELKRMKITDLGKLLQDFSDTAAVIACLDLIISVDTAVVHLAGAMGKPVWVLLGFVPDWRWYPKREDCPWYPAARLFRQPKAGDWKTVFAKAAGRLKPLISQKCQNTQASASTSKA